MTKAKKAISLIVSVVMLLGVLAVGVFANDNTGVAENGTIALSFDKASYSAGDTVRVTVKSVSYTHLTLPTTERV